MPIKSMRSDVGLISTRDMVVPEKKHESIEPQASAEDISDDEFDLGLRGVKIGVIKPKSIPQFPEQFEALPIISKTSTLTKQDTVPDIIRQISQINQTSQFKYRRYALKTC